MTRVAFTRTKRKRRDEKHTENVELNKYNKLETISNVIKTTDSDKLKQKNTQQK